MEDDKAEVLPLSLQSYRESYARLELVIIACELSGYLALFSFILDPFHHCMSWNITSKCKIQHDLFLIIYGPDLNLKKMAKYSMGEIIGFYCQFDNLVLSFLLASVSAKNSTPFERVIFPQSNDII